MELNDLVGRVCNSVVNTGDTIVFNMLEGDMHELYHSQDCCEHVYVEDVCGDLNDLCGTPILHASEDSNYESSGYGDQQWTFYNLRTIKGSVTIRFFGESNGYYSTSVSFR